MREIEHRAFLPAQWRSAKDIEAFRSNPEIGEYFKRVKAIAQFEPIVCEVSYVHHA